MSDQEERVDETMAVERLDAALEHQCRSALRRSVA
jgi:hypothetical protein